MQRSVWRFPLDEWRNVVQVPPGSRIVSVGYTHGSLQAWFEVWPDLAGSGAAERVVYVVPTGGEIPLGTEFFASVVAGEFVFHIFLPVTRGAGARIVTSDAERVTT